MDKVVHFELPFDEKERAVKFYEDVFGWKAIDIPEMEYVLATTAKTDKKGMVQDKGGINGGMFKRTKKIKAPIIVIGVASVDEAVNKAIKAGGKLITSRQSIPNGSYARVSDSEGNIIGLADSRKV